LEVRPLISESFVLKDKALLEGKPIIYSPVTLAVLVFWTIFYF
jgi:hypothetical protein